MCDYMTTTIAVTEETRSLLKLFGRKGETYDDVIKRLFNLVRKAAKGKPQLLDEDTRFAMAASEETLRKLWDNEHEEKAWSKYY